MAKVYVIVKVDVFDGEEEVTIIGTYTDKDEAQRSSTLRSRKKKM